MLSTVSWASRLGDAYEEDKRGKPLNFDNDSREEFRKRKAQEHEERRLLKERSGILSMTTRKHSIWGYM